MRREGEMMTRRKKDEMPRRSQRIGLGVLRITLAPLSLLLLILLFGPACDERNGLDNFDEIKTCGNGTLDPGEACDGQAFGSQTCARRNGARWRRIVASSTPPRSESGPEPYAALAGSV